MTGPACGHLRVSERDLAELGPRGAAALVYAGTFGLPVLRVKPGRAEPNVHHGVHAATTDVAVIRRWFASEPGSNVAARTGRGWLVVDLDVKHGANGPAELLRFMSEHGVTLPQVPWVSTPSGGRHLWLRVEREVRSRSSSSRIIPGVDLLADGGHYVLLPPSVKFVRPLRRPGDPKAGGEVPVPYTWADGCCACQAPSAPGWLLDAMDSMPSIGPAVAGAGGRGSPGGDLPLPSTEDLARSGLVPGSRSKDMYRLAVRLWRKLGLDAEAAVLAECHAIWAATSQGPDPYPWDEALGCIRSARRFAALQDRRDRLAAQQFTAYLESWGRAS